MGTITESGQFDLDSILSQLDHVKAHSGGEYSARCPAHEDKENSLWVRDENGKLLLHCFAGCTFEDILSRCQAPPKPLPVVSPTPKRIVATYPYVDADGTLSYEVLRYEPKGFAQRRADGRYSREGTIPVLFRLPAVLRAVAAGEKVYLPEGEKDVLALEAKGKIATTNAGGANAPWLPQYNEALRGADVILLADWDDAGKKSVLVRHDALLDTAKQVRIYRCPNHKDISDHLAAGGQMKDLVKVDPADLRVQPSNGLAPMSSFEQRSVDWFWQNRIPFGKITIQDGEPNQGKSLVLIDLLARATTGRCMPDENGPGPEPMNVLMVASEDDPEDTLAPRFAAAGADLDKVWFRKDFSLPSKVADLEGYVKQHNIRIVVFDPVVAYFDGDVKINSDPSVRQALAPLAEMAQRTGVAIIFNRHLNKNSTAGASAIYRGGGSIGLIAAARSGWIVGSFPSDPTIRFLAPTKWNLSVKPPAWKFHTKVTDSGHPVVAWLGEASTDADALVGSTNSQGDDSPGRLGEAKEFVLRVLDHQKIASKEFFEQADLENVAAKTLRRALKDLGLRPSKGQGGQHEGWWWGPLEGV